MMPPKPATIMPSFRKKFVVSSTEQILAATVPACYDYAAICESRPECHKGIANVIVVIVFFIFFFSLKFF